MALDKARLLKPVKKLQKLLQNLDSDPPPEKIHALRTKARQFESTFRALDLHSAGVSKSVLKSLGRLRKHAGRVRDLDVLTQFAASVALKGEEEHKVQLLEHLGARRQKRAKNLCSEVKRLRAGLSKDLAQAASRITKLLRKNGSVGAADIARANAAATALKLSGQLAEPLAFNKTNLHPYRLKVKELQDILLLAEAPSARPFVEDLGRVKNAIGEWHDRNELMEIASKVLRRTGKSLLLLELKRSAESSYRQAISLALKLRKTYLRSSSPEKNTASSGVLRAPVWEAMAGFAE